MIYGHYHGPPSRYFGGSNSGLVTAGGLLGALLGGGGLVGFAGDNTGSSSGTKV